MLASTNRNNTAKESHNRPSPVDITEEQLVRVINTTQQLHEELLHRVGGAHSPRSTLHDGGEVLGRFADLVGVLRLRLGGGETALCRKKDVGGPDGGGGDLRAN